MMDHRYVRITPDVVFAADVFPRVDVLQPGRALAQMRADEPAVDPRQIDLFGSEAEYALA